MESLGRLGIDLRSLLLYAVNFGIVVFLVARYLTGPLLKALDERRNQIKKNLDEADELKTEMEKQRKMMESERNEMREKLQQELGETKKSLEEKRKAAEAEIDAKKAKMVEEVKGVIAGEKAGLVKSVEGDILKMVQRMITHIVSEDLPKETIEKSVTKAWEKFKSK